jgi:WD40 repeat protein/serine/threonine protein kinase
MNELDLFAEAIAIGEPGERASLLDRECAGRPEARQRIDQLLDAHFRSHPLLDQPVTEVTGVYAPNEQPGAVIACRYKLLEEIGEGGMGTVWVAEQTQPVRRKVALKLIKAGMDSKCVIARFEAERQALAVMDHPNVAKVFDGGLTETGRPFFVMEYVKGVPITEYCDAMRLSVPERLQLFTQVCQAVQHAHQKGIIHRDLKPSNILVAPYDDKPVPKIIDFGLAKAMHQSLTERTLHTAHDSVLGTPLYMSPEQAQLNNLDVDSRSDIYSLGVLLYELLTGTTPLGRKRFKDAAWDEIKRIIREEEPPRPSARLTSTDTLPTLAACRQTEPLELTKQVRGELDWIVMKALEKDRTRRYETANGLARDVERYLADEVVEARPPTRGYRLSKFARKHRKMLATGAAFAMLLIVGLALTSSLAVWATSAEREANRQRIAAEHAEGEALEAKAEADKQRDAAHRKAYAAGMNLASRAWEDNIVPHARELLEQVPQSVAGVDLRGFEWYYLSRVCHSELRTLKGFSWPVLCVAFSPDGRRVASGGVDRTVKIWDTATGKELLTLEDHLDGPVVNVAFSPDGQRLAFGGGLDTKIWDSTTGKKLVSVAGNGRVAFSPDGQRLATGSDDQSVKIWDSTTGKELISFKIQPGYGYDLAFSPDGKRLAAGSANNEVKIWDSETGNELVSVAGFGAVAFSPDGKRLATRGKPDTVKIWDSATGKELFTLAGLDLAVWSLAFSPDGKRLAIGDTSTVKVWNVSTGKELFSLKGHGATVQCVAFSPDGKHLASGSDDKTVKIWDSTTGKAPFSIDACGPMAFSPDGNRLASGGVERTVKVWDSLTGKEQFSLKGHADLVRSVAFSPDGRRLASGSDDGTMKIWDIDTGKELASLAEGRGRVLTLAFSPDGRRLATGSDGSAVKIWDSASGKELFSLDGGFMEIFSVAFSPDGRRLASGGSYDGAVKIWDVSTGKELFSLKGHARWVWSVAFSPDGRRVASGSDDKTIKIWDTATGKELFSLNGHAGLVSSVAYSPDGRRLASGSVDRTVKIWDTATGEELTSLNDHAGYVGQVAFSPDGERLASTHGDGHINRINIWESRVSPEIMKERIAK